MNNLNSKSVLRRMLAIYNLQQTINGGSAAMYCKLVEKDDHFAVSIKAPSIGVEDLQIEVARNKIRIYNTLSFVDEKGKLMMLPVNFKAIELPSNANQELIEAFEEHNGTYIVKIPKGHAIAPNRVNIPIKQRK